MRGADVDQGGLFSYVSIEQRVPPTHPLRRVRTLLDEALDSMSRDLDRVYAEGGRESVAPERLVVLQVLYSIRSERLCEQLDYNLLFRWFVGLSMDDRIWDHSTFTKKPGSADRRGCGTQAPAAHRAASAARGAYVLGALQRRWHPH
jgi:hypothetical protein